MMPTVTASLLRMNVSEPLINAVQAASAAFAILVVLFASRRGVKTTDSGLIAASAVFLALPYAFNYDMTVVSAAALLFAARQDYRSEEHTSELQSLMRISYAVFCLKKKKKHK